MESDLRSMATLVEAPSVSACQLAAGASFSMASHDLQPKIGSSGTRPSRGLAGTKYLSLLHLGQAGLSRGVRHPFC